MNTKHLLLYGIALTALCSCQPAKQQLSENAVSVAIGGNTYTTTQGDRDRVGQKGIVKWESPETVLTSWFKVSQPGELHLFMRAKTDGEADLNIKIGDKNFDVKLKSAAWDTIPVGTVNITDPGYVRIDMQGITKQGNQFPEISEFFIDGPAAAEPLHFVRNFEAYWGRRGPSVHMKYTLPAENVEYFYNEVTVPEGEDIIGSYYMANGFGEGYFGMQANSEKERRILFSVWSPFNTQDPKSIPEDQRIRMLRHGEGVHIGEFGNEGSGGQSYLVYPWKAGNTYKFLTHIRPDGKGNTCYTAYFFATDENRWRLIASFLRPKTDTWYTNAHSFLENFIPDQGYLTRKVLFSNQWAKTQKGEWQEVTEGMFTHDATGGAGVRVDFAGGVQDGVFFLQNCGFFNESTPYKSMFKRDAQHQVPQIDLQALKQIPSEK